MNNLLTVKNVSITYEGKEVIGGVSFNVAQGDFLVIFGENGSGKSSLVKVLLGLKAPSKGEIAFAEDFNRWEIGYLPQTTAHQNDFPASAWEVVISGCLNQMGHRPFYGKKEKEAAKKNMELLSIYNLKNRHTLIALRAGKIIRLDIRSAPIILIPRTMVIAVRTATAML